MPSALWRYVVFRRVSLAQIARDCKIYSLWEGTNYIQSMDLVGRKWNLKQGQVFVDWLEDIETIIKTNTSREDFAAEVPSWRRFGLLLRIKAMMDEFKQQGQERMLPLCYCILHATSSCAAELCC